MNLDGLPRQVVWSLAMLRVARGGVVSHSAGDFSQDESTVPSDIRIALGELIDCGLVEEGTDTHGWPHQPLSLNELGANVLVDLVDRRLDLPDDRFLTLCIRTIAGLTGVWTASA